MKDCGECKCNGCNFDCGYCDDREDVDCTKLECPEE